TEPYTRHILGIDSGVQSHPKATPRLPQGYPKAPPKPHQCDPHATPKPHQSHPEVIANGQSQIAEAIFSVPIRAIRVRKFRRNARCPGGAESLKAAAGCGRVRPVTWGIAGLEFTYAIIR